MVQLRAVSPFIDRKLKLDEGRQVSQQRMILIITSLVDSNSQVTTVYSQNYDAIYESPYEFS